MTENRKRVLEMLSDGRVSVDEAERLLSGSSTTSLSPSDLCSSWCRHATARRST